MKSLRQNLANRLDPFVQSLLGKMQSEISLEDHNLLASRLECLVSRQGQISSNLVLDPAQNEITGTKFENPATEYKHYFLGKYPTYTLGKNFIRLLHQGHGLAPGHIEVNKRGELADRISERILRHVEINGQLSFRYFYHPCSSMSELPKRAKIPHQRSASEHVGEQLLVAVAFLEKYRLTSDLRYLNAALKLTDYAHLYLRQLCKPLIASIIKIKGKARTLESIELYRECVSASNESLAMLGER